MHQTSRETWDSVHIDGVETVFYFGEPIRENTDKEVYFPIKEGYNTMGHKLLAAFDWALKNREFDYIARVNSSCYVNKSELLRHVQDQPSNNLFAGAIVKGEREWLWGGGQFLISKDVVEKVIANRARFNHRLIEDVALSHLVSDLGIEFTDGKSCSINRNGDKWRSIGYGYDSYEFTNFDEIRKEGVFFYRVKQDLNRDQDEFVMRELFRVL